MRKRKLNVKNYLEEVRNGREASAQPLSNSTEGFQARRERNAQKPSKLTLQSLKKLNLNYTPCTEINPHPSQHQQYSQMSQPLYQGFTQYNQDSQSNHEKRMGRVLAYPPPIQYTSYGGNENSFHGFNASQNQYGQKQACHFQQYKANEKRLEVIKEGLKILNERMSKQQMEEIEETMQRIQKGLRKIKIAKVNVLESFEDILND